MTAVATAPVIDRCTPSPIDVLAALEGADPGAGVEAVRAMWPGTRARAVARIRAAVRDPSVRDTPVALAWDRRLRIADRRLQPNPLLPVPSRLVWDQDQGWHETEPHDLDDYVGTVLTTYGDHRR
jgi:hypothetical protein